MLQISETIKRLRATQAGNQMTMQVCDELERLLAREPVPLKSRKVEGGCPVCAERRKAKTLAMRRWRKKMRHG
jgi:hypothetical protein